MLIVDYSDYRHYLKDYQKTLPKNGWGFVSQLATAIGVSQVFMSQVFSGLKELSNEHAILAAEYLNLTEAETEYFFWLVTHARAGHHRLKKVAENKIQKLKSDSRLVRAHVKPDTDLTEEQKAVFYSNYLYSALRHFVNIGKGKTLDEVIEQFTIGRTKALKILDFLVESGLCIQSGAKYRRGGQRTFIDRTSPHWSRHVTNWRQKTIYECDNIAASDLIYTSPISISKKDFVTVHRQLVALAKNVSKLIENTEPEIVVCWNMDWYEVKK